MSLFERLNGGARDWVALGLVASWGLWHYVLRDWLWPPKEPTLRLRSSSMTMLSGAGEDATLVKRLKAAERNVVVFYGSQTGKAEEAAGRLARDAQRYGLRGLALDPETVDLRQLAQLPAIQPHLAIFCLATYGEGEPTDNALGLFDFLNKANTDLRGLNFAVFGLGNKTYEHYNLMGKFADRKLADMGGSRVHPLGLGDDDANLEDDFLLWRESFWPAVVNKFDLASKVQDISIRQYKLLLHPHLSPESVFAGEVSKLGAFARQKPPFDSKNPFLARVLVNRELHTGGGRSCRHMELDLSGSEIHYEAGDHVAVFPTNDEAVVEGIGKALCADLDQIISLRCIDEEAAKKTPFPCPTTYRTALRHYVDLLSPVRTFVLQEFADHCQDPKERDFLRGMTSTSDEARKRYDDWVRKDRRTLLDIFRDLPSCKPPLDLVLDVRPRLQARYYSISSSPKLSATNLSITAVVVKYSTRLGREMKGVATTWLAAKDPTAQPPPTVPLYVRRSGFRLPHKDSTAVVLVGPGTGLAPFRGFLQERDLARRAGKEVGPTELYFGCRHPDQDYIYRGELAAWRAAGTLSGLHEAFSRIGPAKVYVQDLIKRDGARLWELFGRQSGHVYVCGDAKGMAGAVHHAFVRLAMDHGRLSVADAKAFLKRAETQKRYQADVWS